MARETKQDRVVRGMLDQVTEHLHELKSLEANTGTKEMDVERWAQSFLRNCLGYTSTSGYSIRAQETKGKHRPDLIVLKGDKPIFLVEVKRLGFDLTKSNFRSGKIQLAEYLQVVGNVKWGVLTNGCEWKLYDFSNIAVGGVEIACFDMKDDDHPVDTSRKVVEELCYDMLDFHEMSYGTESWVGLAKEATAFSPESLAKAILSSDVVKYIARSIRGEHEYKANMEVLSERVYWLLEKGLNDAIPGWNDAKIAEFQKYLKSQRRATRRARKNKATTSDANPSTSTEGETPLSKPTGGDGDSSAA